MAWMLVRLDDRLLHGQVAVGWSGRLQPERILVADDSLASSDWERELVEASGPPGVEVRVIPLDSVGPETYGAERSFLLLRGPRELHALSLNGVTFAEVNLGGLHAAQGRTRLLDYLHLAPEEIQQLREIAKSGSRLFAQDVPGNPRHELHSLLGSGE